ncbi:MAG: phytanoyl-CoA dioxygenase family protein [Gemmatimonadales bacterium]|nr:phytanoyl-CoA dioxygenase family protein [Gemmatimonadales bacterium]
MHAVSTSTRNPGQREGTLSDEDVASYHEKGYLTVRSALDQELVGRMRDVTLDLFRQSGELTASTEHFDIGPGHTKERPILRRISRPTEVHEVFVEVAFESKVGDIVAELIGRPVKFYHAKVNFKLPSSTVSDVQWHQDWPHFPHTNYDMLAISVPMHARTIETGCIQVVEASHKEGPLSTWRDGRYVFTCEHSMKPSDFDRIAFMECEPGDVLAHHGLTVHASTPNPSDTLIATLTIQYAAADAFAYTAPVIDSIHRNRMVRGEPSRFARVDAGMIELPPDFSAGYKSLFALQDSAQSGTKTANQGYY